MKQKKANKLSLAKETIQNLREVLERDDQKKVMGGTYIGQLNTDVPQYCKP